MTCRKIHHEWRYMSYWKTRWFSSLYGLVLGCISKSFTQNHLILEEFPFPNHFFSISQLGEFNGSSVAVPVPQVLEEKFHIQDDDVNRWGHVMSKTDTLESRLTIQKIPRSNDILYINVGLHNPQGIFGGIHYFGKAPVCFRSNFPSQTVLGHKRQPFTLFLVWRAAQTLWGHPRHSPVGYHAESSTMTMTKSL